MKNTVDDNNEIFEILIEWGKTHLIIPGFENHLHELRKYFELTITNTKDFKKLLLNYINELENEVKNAINILSNIELITASEGDEIWVEAEESFFILDKTNYLKETLYNLLTKDERQNLNQSFNKLKQIEINIVEWLYDSEFSALRFTVLNKVRKAYLDIIPEEKKYLFPWYDLFSEYDENTISTVIDNYHLFGEKTKNILEKLIPNTSEIAFELKQDKKLLSVIENEYLTKDSIDKAFSKRSSLRLLQISCVVAPSYQISEHLEKVGLVRVAIKLIHDNEDPLMNYYNRIYWLFLSAFCGPDLEEKWRLYFLEKVEKLIKNVNIEDIEVEVGKILNPLKLWFNNEIEDQQLAEISFAHWLNLLETKAESMSESKEDASGFFSTVESISIVSFEKLIEVILSAKLVKTRLERVVSTRIHYGIEESEATRVIINNNPIKLSILPNDKGEYVLLAAPSFIKESNHLEDYKKFWEKFDRLNFYWGGYSFSYANQFHKKINPTKIEEKFFYTTKGKGAIIGISDDVEHLKNFVKYVDDLILSNCDPEQILTESNFTNVIVFIVSFERVKSGITDEHTHQNQYRRFLP
jgi:hypothetical protein